MFQQCVQQRAVITFKMGRISNQMFTRSTLQVKFLQNSWWETYRTANVTSWSTLLMTLLPKTNNSRWSPNSCHTKMGSKTLRSSLSTFHKTIKYSSNTFYSNSILIYYLLSIFNLQEDFENYLRKSITKVFIKINSSI